MNILEGFIIITAGVFVCVYGKQLFRLALTVLGFGLGAILGWWLASNQQDLMRFLISLAAGGVGAAILYTLFRIGIYIAGGILGLIVASFLTSLLGLTGIILVVGAVLGGFCGHWLGNKIIILATAAAGAFQVVYGLAVLFVGEIAPDAAPADLLATPLALVVFVIIMAISFLSQVENNRIRVRIFGSPLLRA
jgi:hypothetical protein